MVVRGPRKPSPNNSDESHGTPEAPRWGPRYDDQDVGGTRRSRRTTNNPFSSANNGKVRTPERRAIHDGTMPPSPPASPSSRTSLSTPKQSKHKKTARFASTHLRASSLLDNSSLILTPAKTPKSTTPPSTASSRRVVFQHGDPSDAMPTPRKIKSTPRRNFKEMFGSRKPADDEAFEIHTDWNARRPTLDLSEDNAFVGQRSDTAKRPNRIRTTDPSPLPVNMSDEEMSRRVENDEGMLFSFRGKKVFRPYEDTLADVSQAEALGYQPIRRSSGRPALLNFTTRLAANPAASDEEEAVTDIEITDDVVTSNEQLASSQGSVSGQQKPGSHNIFSAWARTKPAGAKSARKREVAEEGIGNGAVKKAKNLV